MLEKTEKERGATSLWNIVTASPPRIGSLCGRSGGSAGGRRKRKMVPGAIGQPSTANGRYGPIATFVPLTLEFDDANDHTSPRMLQTEPLI